MRIMFDFQSTLKGTLVELSPLRAQDEQALFLVASDPLIWGQHPASDRYKPEVFRAFFLESLASGGALTIRECQTGRVIGSSRFHGYNADLNEIEIGWTFLARSHWGGTYNGDVKRLMLRHAFHFVKRVIFLIGPRNIRSQRAIERLGAVRVGARPDAAGSDAFVYEITSNAWTQRWVQGH